MRDENHVHVSGSATMSKHDTHANTYTTRKTRRSLTDLAVAPTCSGLSP